jgi:hypothetical protein
VASAPESRLNHGLSLQASVELAHEVKKVHSKRCQPGAQLDNVQAPDATLDLADGRLPSPQALRHVGLPEPHGLAPATQHGEEHLVGLSVQRFEHDGL